MFYYMHKVRIYYVATILIYKVNNTVYNIMYIAVVNNICYQFYQQISNFLSHNLNIFLHSWNMADNFIRNVHYKIREPSTSCLVVYVYLWTGVAQGL